MNILVLNGSPHKNGNTAAMVAAFAEGARAAGNDVTVVEIAHLGISGCRACEHCHTVTLGECIIRDDMQQLYPLLQAADMLVLASPIYYFGYTAQLQAAIHRTYALGPLTNLKKAALMLSSGSDDVYEGAVYEYRKAFVEWMHAEDAGVFTAFGAQNKSEAKLAELRAFGASLGDVQEG